jgi:hypothetical protein
MGQKVGKGCESKKILSSSFSIAYYHFQSLSSSSPPSQPNLSLSAHSSPNTHGSPREPNCHCETKLEAEAGARIPRPKPGSQDSRRRRSKQRRYSVFTADLCAVGLLLDRAQIFSNGFIIIIFWIEIYLFIYFCEPYTGVFFIFKFSGREKQRVPFERQMENFHIHFLIFQFFAR